MPAGKAFGARALRALTGSAPGAARDLEKRARRDGMAEIRQPAGFEDAGLEGGRDGPEAFGRPALELALDRGLAPEMQAAPALGRDPGRLSGLDVERQRQQGEGVPLGRAEDRRGRDTLGLQPTRARLESDGVPRERRVDDGVESEARHVAEDRIDVVDRDFALAVRVQNELRKLTARRQAVAAEACEQGRPGVS